MIGLYKWIRNTLCCILTLGIAAPVFAAGFNPDSAISLPVVPVIKTKVQSIADYAVVLSITDTMSRQFDDFSMDKYLNTVPGVQWQSYGGGSTKISIRGSGLSAQFGGVRDLKIYMDDVPLTTPDGFSPIEFTDPFLFNAVEIFKGPSGTTTYGAENGGTLIFKQDTGYEKGLNVVGGLTNGVYGTLRAEGQIKYGGSNGFISLSAVSQNTSGYRQQEFVYRNIINLLGHYSYGKHSFNFWAEYNYGEWGLPGAVTLQSAIANPTLALPYSVYADAHLKKNAGIGGLTYKYDFNQGLSWKTTLFAGGNNKYNPFGTAPSNNGIKFEKQATPGIRSVLEQNIHLKKLEIRNYYGIEYQTEFDQLKNFANEGGAVPGAAIENSHTQFNQIIVFAESNLHFITGTILNVGLSFDNNNLNYANAVPVNGVIENYKHWYQPSVLPSITLTQKIAGTQNAYASGSAGMSVPQFLETVNTDGTLNRNLKNESSWNAEGGFKGTVRQIYFDYTVDLFCQLYRNFILPYNPQGNELVYYQNAGNTRDLGLEASANFHIPFTGAGGTVFKEFVVSGNYAYSSFVFQQYISDGMNYRGYNVPGVPAHAVNAEVNLQTAPGFYFNANLAFFTATALNNANTNFAPAYHTFDLKAGYFIHARNVTVDIFVGVNNVLNSLYYSFFNLNAVGGKYFNVAPARYVYGGLKFSMGGIKKK